MSTNFITPAGVEAAQTYGRSATPVNSGQDDPMLTG